MPIFSSGKFPPSNNAIEDIYYESQVGIKGGAGGDENEDEEALGTNSLIETARDPEQVSLFHSKNIGLKDDLKRAKTPPLT